MEFAQSVMTLRTARIIGQKRRSRTTVAEQMLTVQGAEGCDQLVDDGGEATLWMHNGIELEAAFAKDRSLPDPKDRITDLINQDTEVQSALQSTSTQRRLDRTIEEECRTKTCSAKDFRITFRPVLITRPHPPMLSFVLAMVFSP